MADNVYVYAQGGREWRKIDIELGWGRTKEKKNGKFPQKIGLKRWGNSRGCIENFSEKRTLVQKKDFIGKIHKIKYTLTAKIQKQNQFYVHVHLFGAFLKSHSGGDIFKFFFVLYLWKLIFLCALFLAISNFSKILNIFQIPKIKDKRAVKVWKGQKSFKRASLGADLQTSKSI